jgi:hypothetical protein
MYSSMKAVTIAATAANHHKSAIPVDWEVSTYFGSCRIHFVDGIAIIPMRKK